MWGKYQGTRNIIFQKIKEHKSELWKQAYWTLSTTHPQQFILDSTQQASYELPRYPARKDTDPDEQMVGALWTSG